MQPSMLSAGGPVRRRGCWRRWRYWAAWTILRSWGYTGCLVTLRLATRMRLSSFWNIFLVRISQPALVLISTFSGGDLYSRVMNSEEALTEKDVAGFIKQILLGNISFSINKYYPLSFKWCSGLAYIHSQNIVHLDIKPENIVCETGNSFNIKLVDFGLARRLSDSKDICVMQGTPDFVSPEVWQLFVFGIIYDYVYVYWR